MTTTTEEDIRATNEYILRRDNVDAQTSMYNAITRLAYTVLGLWSIIGLYFICRVLFYGSPA